MRQRLLILTTILTAAIAVAVHQWLPGGAEPVVIAAEPLVDDGNEIASFASYANLRLDSPEIVDRSIQEIRDGWHPGGLAMLIEAWQFQPPITEGAKILGLLQEKSGQKFDGSFGSWQKWLWAQEYEPHPQYASFKAALYTSQDRRFSEYFADTDDAQIRLDEIVWGGVMRDGIPPLKNPRMLAADEAIYLDDDNVVFGVVLGGDARCYPKRILAWHEMFKDTIGGESVCGVYCTLCGSLIVYRTDSGGQHHELGTSGFLYRSNKLMYDHATKSLWSTLKGEPVVGPLVDQSIKLRRRHVVTTTWGEWKRRYPDTTVLSLKTGYWRDYGEGVAYRDYFATQRLMFEVPKIDGRLKPKDEVLALRNDDGQLALAADFLLENRLYCGTLGEQRFVVLTDASGANRVYESGDVEFKSIQGDVVTDSSGSRWTVTADKLNAETGGRSLSRLPAHRAFWFAWHAQYPQTRFVN